MRNPLRVQAVAMMLVSVPFALKGGFTHDMAAWATAFLALGCGIAVGCLAVQIERID